MTEENHSLLQHAYAAFNARDIAAVLATMHDEVEWPNGLEGGVVIGHAAIRSYWTRQWDLVDPMVEPVAFHTLPDGRIDVRVHQVVRSLLGERLLDHHVHHVYTLESGRVRRMEIADD